MFLQHLWLFELLVEGGRDMSFKNVAVNIISINNYCDTTAEIMEKRGCTKLPYVNVHNFT